MFADLSEDAWYVYNGFGELEAVYNVAMVGTTPTQGTRLRERYLYDDGGQRLMRETWTWYVNGSTVYPTAVTRTWYIRDGGGALLDVYEQAWQRTTSSTYPVFYVPVIKETYLYAQTRLGVYRRGVSNGNGTETSYELTDHLGNVRAVIRRERKLVTYNGSQASFAIEEQVTDYFVHGWAMPERDRNLSSNEYRFAYQGIELDPATGNHFFELRTFDARSARWTNPDPLMQCFSPYLAMGNNPVSMVDPTGGLALGIDPNKVPIKYPSYTVPVEEVFAFGTAASSSFGFSDALDGLINSSYQLQQYITSDAYGLRTPEWNPLIRAEQEVLGSNRLQQLMDGFNGKALGTITNLLNTIRTFENKSPLDRVDMAVEVVENAPAGIVNTAGEMVDNAGALANGDYGAGGELFFDVLSIVGTEGLVGEGVLLRDAARPKLIRQFTSSTIKDAVALTMRQKELHIFSNKLHPKPWLNQLSTQMGGNKNLIRAALENANGRILPDAYGVFNTPVSVGGVNFTIRGFMNQGTPIINSIFIP